MANSTTTTTPKAPKPTDPSTFAAAYFAAAILVLIFLLFVTQWSAFFLKRRNRRNDGAILRKAVAGTRFIRSLLIRKVYGFTNSGHALLYVIYIMINITLAFWSLDLSQGKSSLNGLGKRLGWVTAWNLCLITFLALKNTPLAFLTAYSYERLNVLHRIAGYTTVACVLLHSVVFICSYQYRGNLSELRDRANVMGQVAGISMLIIAATAFFLRRMRYEVFYVIHIILFMLIIIAVAMHRHGGYPNGTAGVQYFPYFAAAIWASDRIVRGARILFFAYNNNATITPLPNDGVRIVLKRNAPFAVPGAHLFLWIPTIRAFETHPFTISSIKPLELIVAAQDGFTKDLVEHAKANPGVSLRASMDGPYGALPNFSRFDRLVLIAGGSGGSFTFGVAVDVLRRLSSERSMIIDFIWVVREKESLTWFSGALRSLQADSRIRLNIHVTNHKVGYRSGAKSGPSPVHLKGQNPAESQEKKDSVFISASGETTPTTSSLSEKDASAEASAEAANTIAATKNTSETSSDIEKSSASIPEVAGLEGLMILPHCPDVAALIRASLSATGPDETVMVAACGPVGMMNVTRQTVASCIAGKGASISLHIEQFHW